MLADEWHRVKWAYAHQVTRVLGWREQSGDPPGDLPPAAYFEALRNEGRLIDAVEFLSQALPRWEAAAWAARSVRELRGELKVGEAEADALRAALLWVQDPTEPRRRAAFDAAGAAASDSPERVAALAAFFSGGSIAPEDCEPLPAPRDAAGLCAAGAITIAAAQAQEMEAALLRCLDRGVDLARAGGQESSP